MSIPGTLSRSNYNPSINPSYSYNNKQLNNIDTKKQNIQNIKNPDFDENEENEGDSDFEESFAEEQEEKEDEEVEKKEESQTMKIQGEEGKSRLERVFIYLRSGFSWRPIPKIRSTVLCLEITGAIFIVIGIIIVIFSQDIKQIEIRYDNNEKCEIGTKCEINFTIPKKMKKNVFVYYRLKNFYQNHRRYMKSKSIKQLKGNVMKESDIKDDCEPIVLNKDLYEGISNINGTVLDPDGVAHPCGLIAKSFFNDSFEIKRKGENETITINNTKISWSKDKEKFKNSENYTEHQWIDVEDERFIAWMRPAALPDFRKPWGRIEKELNKGDYTLTITNNYPVKSFKGKKYFILSTVNGLGGRNYFLAILYFIIGGVSIVAGIMFWIGYKKYNIDKIEKLD